MSKGVEISYEGCTTIARIVGKDGRLLGVGVAHWNPEDPYDKAKGKLIALGRAKKQSAANEERQQRGEIEAGAEAGPVGDTDGEILPRLLVAATKCADQEGLCFIHASGGPADYVVMTEQRYVELSRRVFGDQPIPESDPEWRHSHVEPEMLDA